MPPGEREFHAATTLNVNMLVPWYLMACYAYYHRDESLLLDSTFDAMCVRLAAHWDDITHYHKHLVDRAALSAGTGFQLRLEDIPGIVIGAATRLLQQ